MTSLRKLQFASQRPNLIYKFLEIVKKKSNSKEKCAKGMNK